MKIKAVVLMMDGVPDRDGEAYVPQGVKFERYATVTKDFNRGQSLGIATLHADGDKLIAEFDFPSSKFPPVPLYMSVGGVIDKEKESYHITEMGIGTNLNTDVRIKSLQEQNPTLPVAEELNETTTNASSGDERHIEDAGLGDSEIGVGPDSSGEVLSDSAGDAVAVDEPNNEPS